MCPVQGFMRFGGAQTKLKPTTIILSGFMKLVVVTFCEPIMQFCVVHIVFLLLLLY